MEHLAGADLSLFREEILPTIDSSFGRVRRGTKSLSFSVDMFRSLTAVDRTFAEIMRELAIDPESLQSYHTSDWHDDDGPASLDAEKQEGLPAEGIARSPTTSEANQHMNDLARRLRAEVAHTPNLTPVASRLDGTIPPRPKRKASSNEKLPQQSQTADCAADLKAVWADFKAKQQETLVQLLAS